jgi:hypothetical protein
MATEINIFDSIIYNNALLGLKDRVADLVINSTSLPLIIKYVIEIIEVTDLKGRDKKIMALKLMSSIIVDLTNEEDKKILTPLLDDGIISDLIELVIDATKGKLDVNVAVKIASGCFSKFIHMLLKIR